MMRPKCQDPMPHAIPAQRLEGDHGGDGAMVCAKRMLTWGTRALWVAMVMVLLQGPLAASVDAQEGPATKTTEVHRNLHHERDDLHHDKGAWILGPKALAITIVHEDKVINTFGGGLSLERNVVEGWLEVELVAALFEEEQHVVQSFELLAKKPFHFGSVASVVASPSPR
ncbi:MAG: hypothetical protein AAFX99_33950 [Myxococcota bacterium]